MTRQATQQATRVDVFWDRGTEPQNWAYRLWFDGVESSSGPLEDYCDIPDQAAGSQLQDAVVSVAHCQGVEITRNDVVYHSEEGGWARWQSDWERAT